MLWYLKLNQNTESIYLEELYFLVLTMVSRSFVISCRYGYISNSRISTLRKSQISTEYMKQDLLLLNLLVAVPQTLDGQIEETLWRNEIEEEEFVIRFLEDPQHDFARKITYRKYYDQVPFDVNDLRGEIYNRRYNSQKAQHVNAEVDLA